MQNAAIGIEHAFVHHLAQRRMREDRVHQLCLGRFQRLADSIALDQLGHFRTDHVRAEQFARLGVKHRLDETLGFAQRNSLAIADEGKLAGLDVMACFLRSRFGPSCAGGRPCPGWRRWFLQQ